MQKKAFALLALAFFFLAGSVSQAALLFEPYVSDQIGGLIKAPSATSFSYTGLAYGARLGLDSNHLLLGLEYMGDHDISLKPSQDISPLSFTNKTTNDYGVFLGFNLNPWPMQLIATYIAEAESESVGTTSGQMSSDTEERGYGYKVGLFFDPFRYLNFGVEYYQIVNVYTKDILNHGTYGSLVPASTSSAFLVTISFPLELGSNGGRGKRRR